MKEQYYWHVHHEKLLEKLTEPIQNRIEYIKSQKPESEIELRLKLLHKVKNPQRALKEWREYEQKRAPIRREFEKRHSALWKDYEPKHYSKWKEYEQKNNVLWEKYCGKKLALLKILKTHRHECPNCPWDGDTIFPAS